MIIYIPCEWWIGLILSAVHNEYSIVFLSGAYVKNIVSLAVLYCSGDFLVGVNSTFPFFLFKIADEGDLALSRAVGSTINCGQHFIPVIEGLVRTCTCTLCSGCFPSYFLCFSRGGLKYEFQADCFMLITTSLL